MKNLRKVLPWELFRGVKEGKITSLIFDEDEFQDVEIGDLIEFCSINDIAKMYFISSQIICFKDITDEDAKQCGFSNRDILAHYLMNRYNINLFFVGDYPNSFDKKLFCLVRISDSPSELIKKNKMVINNTLAYNMDYYNVEYDDKPWRVINERL